MFLIFVVLVKAYLNNACTESSRDILSSSKDTTNEAVPAPSLTPAISYFYLWNHNPKYCPVILMHSVYKQVQHHVFKMIGTEAFCFRFKVEMEMKATMIDKIEMPFDWQPICFPHCCGYRISGKMWFWFEDFFLQDETVRRKFILIL